MTNDLDVIMRANYHSLEEFSSFKKLTLEDINNLRMMLFNSVEIDYSWSERILRFLEIRMSEIKKRLQINYNSNNLMVVFKDCIISFLLEIYYYKKDYRFLNVAMKLMAVKFKFSSKQSFYNENLCLFLKSNL
jgi:hypothetical protein